MSENSIIDKVATNALIQKGRLPSESTCIVFDCIVCPLPPHDSGYRTQTPCAGYLSLSLKRKVGSDVSHPSHLRIHKGTTAPLCDKPLTNGSRIISITCSRLYCSDKQFARSLHIQRMPCELLIHNSKRTGNQIFPFFHFDLLDSTL